MGMISNTYSEVFDTPATREAEVRDWVPGTAMLIKAEVLSNVGLLDESFHQGYEDYEFCHRARAKGYFAIYEPRATVRHKGSKSKRTSARSSVRMSLTTDIRVYMRFFKRFGPNPKVDALAAMLIGYPLQMWKYLLVTRDPCLKQYYRQKMLQMVGLRRG